MDNSSGTDVVPTDLRSSGIKPKTKAQPPPPPFIIPLNVTLCFTLATHVLAAVFEPIHDCDETFNYWEPLHYLNHGYGLQTWEYSPEFGIRSWAYIVLHSIPTKIASIFGRSKLVEFYSLRILLAFVCAATETRLYAAISRTLHPRIGVYYLMVVVLAPGMFHASAAFLPSSFAMYTSTLGLTAFMERRGGPRTASAIMWFGIGALLGWPFAGALIFPFVLEDWVVAASSGDMFGTVQRYLDGIVRCLIVLAVQVGCDAFFYRRLVIVPWNIVAYNVFGGKDRGPNIFGTEPWDFYLRNLLINFNFIIVFALVAGPFLVIQALFSWQMSSQQNLRRTLTLISPFYLWFGIFTLQPHKEERFMYPAYPFVALNAAIAFHMFLSWLGTSDPTTLLGKIPVRAKFALILPLVGITIILSLLRTGSDIEAYRAPMEIYTTLQAQGTVHANSTVCFGKDWYRFPASHFLPNDAHAKFVKSAFDGLLPGEFQEASDGSGLFPGTWLIPRGMNDRNEEDPGKYIDIKHCDYLVDSYMTGSKSSVLEPLYALEKEWKEVTCRKFLDASATSLVPRLIWIPDWRIVPERFRRVWGRHCLLGRKTPS